MDSKNLSESEKRAKKDEIYGIATKNQQSQIEKRQRYSDFKDNKNFVTN